MSAIRLTEVASTPSDSASGQTQIYAKTDGKIYTKRADNAETAVQNSANGGKILQVVEQTWNLDMTPAVTFSSDGVAGGTASSYVHAFSGTITPSSTTSKILVQATVQVYGADTVGNWDAPHVLANVHRLKADGTVDVELMESGYFIYQRENEPIPSYVGGPITTTRLDVPSSTDALVYDVVVKCAGNWTICYMYGGVMIMQEVAG